MFLTAGVGSTESILLTRHRSHQIAGGWDGFVLRAASQRNAIVKTPSTLAHRQKDYEPSSIQFAVARMRSSTLRGSVNGK